MILERKKLERNARVYIALVNIIVLLQEAREPVCQVYLGDTVPFYIPTKNSPGFSSAWVYLSPALTNIFQSRLEA